jgi:hypothetical protein
MGVALVLPGIPLTHYYDPVPEQISSLDEAQKLIRKQHEDLKELNDSIEKFGNFMYLFMIGVFWLLPTLYAFAKAVVAKEETDHPGPKKPVLNLDED